MKKCSDCKTVKPFSDFSKNVTKLDGHQNICKACEKVRRTNKKDKLREQSKAYREKNKEKIRESKRKHYKENQEKIKAKSKKWYLENQDKVKEYREENKDKLKEKMNIYREENKDALSLYSVEYYRKNKDKILEYRRNNKDIVNAATARRRAQRFKATPSWLTEDQLEEIKDFYTMCQMFQIYTGLTYHVDHIIPLQGEDVCGLHVPWNLQILEASENLSKSNKLLEEYSN
jgi:hypothetical protein